MNLRPVFALSIASILLACQEDRPRKSIPEETGTSTHDTGPAPDTDPDCDSGQLDDGGECVPAACGTGTWGNLEVDENTVYVDVTAAEGGDGSEAAPFSSIQAGLDAAGEADGGLVAVAAGNSGPDPDTIGCPGCAEEAVTVAAVDRDGRVADFSSRGGSKFPDKPDVAAPGVNIYSGTARASLVDIGDLDAGFGYAAISGTSMATPHVAGLLALLKHRNPAITERQFKEAVRQRGGPFNNATGWGVPKWPWFAP